MKSITRPISVKLGAAGLLALAPLAVTVIGCADARRPNTIPARTLQQNPRLAEGQRVFMQNCNQCHVGGAAGLGPSINEKRVPAFLLKFQVRHGMGQMPAFGPRRISDSQLEDLTRYVKYLHDHPNGPVRG